MKDHLSPAEFVDAAEGLLPASRSTHVDGCARCREQLDAVRGALEAAAAVDVPEPSPLYWEHMAARVRARVSEDAIAPAWHAWLGARTLLPAATALALVAAVFVAGQMSGQKTATEAPVPDAPALAATASAEVPVESEESDAWQVLTSAAADMPIEDAHAVGLAVPAGAVDRAVQRMTPAELDELRQLLRSELHRSGD